MKKYLLVVLCLLLLVVVGCGKKENEDTPTPTPVPTEEPKNTLTCTGSISESGMDMQAEVIAEFDDDDKLTDATIVYDLGSEETATSWCALFKYMEDEAKGVKVECSGTKITIKGYASITDDEDEEETMLGHTKEEFRAAMAEEGVTCR